MLILGLLLIVVAAVVFGYMFFGTSDLEPLDIDLGVFTVQLTPLHLYLLGAATLVILALGLVSLAAGMRASRRRRHEVKELRKAVRDGGTDHGRRDREAVPAPVHETRADQSRTDHARADQSRTDQSRTDGSRTDGSWTNDPAPYEREVPHDGAGPRREVPSDSQAARSDDPEIALPSDYQRGQPDGPAPGSDGIRH